MKEKINHIIAKVLSGESCTSEELLLLSEWLGEDERRKSEFMQLTSYWDAEVTLQKCLNSSDLAFEKLSKRIEEATEDKKPVRKINPKLFLIAASFTLVIVISSFLCWMDVNRIETYTYAAQNDNSEFYLTDGTHVVLNENSKLTYTNKYGESVRRVELEGEGYFDVRKNAGKPFIVHTAAGEITVLGTIFNVRAYDTDSCFTATLVEGSIRFETSSQSVLLSPDQQLTLNKNSAKIEVKAVNADVYTAWKDGLLKYRSVSLKELLKRIEAVYDVSIILKDRKIGEAVVSGSFVCGEPIDSVLSVIQRNLPFKWTKQKDTIIIYK